jgi:hypothetical protein
MTTAPIIALVDVDVGLIVGLLPSFHSRNAGAAHHEVLNRLFDVLDIQSVTSPHSYIAVNDWNCDMGMQCSTYNGKVFCYMFCANTKSTFDAFYQTITKCQQGPSFIMNNAKVHVD